MTLRIYLTSPAKSEMLFKSPSICCRVLKRVYITFSVFEAKGTVRRAIKKPSTCFAALLQNELNSDVALFTTHKKAWLQDWFERGW